MQGVGISNDTAYIDTTGRCAVIIGQSHAATFFADKYVKHDRFLLLVT